MCKEYKVEVKLSLKSGQKIRVTEGGDIIWETSGRLFSIHKAHWILTGFASLPPGTYKVTNQGTLVPHKPLPELKGGEICEVILFDGDRFVSFYEGSRKDNIGIFYTFNHEPTNASVAQHILIDSIQSITILKPISE